MIRRLNLALCLPLFFAASFNLAAAHAADVRKSVVKVYATQRFPNLLKPWMAPPARKVSGTGTVIEGGRILTNAHVVMHARQIYVQPYESSDKLDASVVAIAPGMDLAVLKLDDADFFKTHPPLKIEPELPQIKDQINVYGYPIGGVALSVTRGTVTRIEYSSYAFGQSGLRIDVSAAINPGNSGGPAIVGKRMVGLVFGVSNQGGKNIGYLVPNEEIVTFLDETSRGMYLGKLQFLCGMQSLENHALRARIGLKKSTTGVLVNDPAAGASDLPLKMGDIVTHIGKHKIDNLGMVRLSDSLRVSFTYLVAKLARDKKIPLTIIRDGGVQQIRVPVVYHNQKSIFPYLKNGTPSYFIWGPICFSPASAEMMRMMSPFLATAWSARRSPLSTRINDTARFPGEQLVVVTSFLPHKTGRGYGNPTGQVVGSVNGVKIKNLGHLVETLRDAKGEFVEFDFAGKYVETLVFNRKEVDSAMEEILRDNGIRRRGSADVLPVWNGKR